MTLLLGASCVQDSAELPDELTTEETEQALQFKQWDDGMRSFSSQGTPVPETGEYFQAQGTNGRSCVTCHPQDDGWAFNADTANRVFDQTGGLDPLFSRLDADIPTLSDAQIDAMTVEERRDVFSMLLQAKFTRNISLPAVRDFDLTGVTDPFGVSAPTSATTTGKMWFFRRAMPTTNFKSVTVSWDSVNTMPTLADGLIRQARGNVTGAQEGPPAPDAVIFDIVDFELSLATARQWLPLVGQLDANGAKGGPVHHLNQPLVAGRFDLFDAYRTDWNPFRRAIYRGQEVFNNGDVNGKKCSGCHNAANSGQNVAGLLFDVGAGRVEFALPDMAVFTFTQPSTGAVHVTTDPGRGGRNGVFADLSKFKTPTLRGLGSRDAYFHNGAARNLLEVVELYETTLGFDFTLQQKVELILFLAAL